MARGPPVSFAKTASTSLGKGSVFFRQTSARLRSRRAVGRTLSPSVLTGCTGGRWRTEQLPEVRQGSGRRAFGRETRE